MEKSFEDKEKQKPGKGQDLAREGRVDLNRLPEFKQALPVLDTLIEGGYEAYFVGGSVRDALLGLDLNDVDIATSAQPEEVKALFKKTVDVGIDHGTVMVLQGGTSYEITTFRTESTYQDHRRPDSVHFVRSLEEDLKRRDFTINALALDRNGAVTDLFDGIQDLEDGLIRAVGQAEERFNEDALRMMRAVRFAGQLGFEIAQDTKTAIKKHRQLLEEIAVERIQVEWVKLLTGQDRQKGVKAMIETKLYDYCPLLSNKKAALTYLVANPHSLDSDRQAWALLLYYVRYIQPKGYQEDINTFLRTWKTSKAMMDQTEILVEGLEDRKNGKSLDPYAIYQQGLDLSLDIETLLEVLGQEGKQEEVKETYQQLAIHSSSDLDLTGYDLMEAYGRKPGPWLGSALNQAEKAVVRGDWPNDKNQLLQHLKDYAIEDEKQDD